MMIFLKVLAYFYVIFDPFQALKLGFFLKLLSLNSTQLFAQEITQPLNAKI